MKKTIFLLTALLLAVFVMAAPRRSGGLVMQSIMSGNWSAASTWAGGQPPGPADQVQIMPGHTLTLDINVQIEDLTIQAGGKLLVASADSLWLGVSGGGAHSLQVMGELEISNGMIYVAGSVHCGNGSVFIMSDGHLKIDGNDGTSAGSVPSGTDLLTFSAAMAGFNFNGGLLQLVDPPYHTNSKAINSAFDFGANSRLRFGDSSGQHLGAVRFGKYLPGKIGHLEVFRSGTGYGHDFRLYQPMVVQGNCIVEKGNYVPPDFFGLSSFHVLDSLTVMGNLEIKNSFTIGIMDTAIVEACVRVLGDLVLDTLVDVRSIGASRLSVNGDLVLHGQLESYHLYMGYNFELAPSTHQQQIRGTSVAWQLHISHLYINNTSDAGVRLHPEFGNNGDETLHLMTLNFIQGKFFAGNKKVEVNWSMNGGGPQQYLVLDTGGRFLQLGGTVHGYIGADSLTYNPITVYSVQGQKYEIGIRKEVITQAGTSGIPVVWTVEVPAGQIAPADLTVQWNASQEDPLFHRNSCYLARYTGGVWQSISPWLPAAGSGPFTKTVTGITGLTRFTVRSSDILPVRLVDFHALPSGKTIQLQWVAEDLGNFSHFELERKVAAGQLQPLARIPSRPGYGPITYNYSDAEMTGSPVFYRLKMVDMDGSFEYSQVIRVDRHSPGIVLYPNPVQQVLYVSGIDGFEKIMITDMKGSTVLVEKITSNQKMISTQNWSKGMYQLGLYGKGSRQTLFFVKE